MVDVIGLTGKGEDDDVAAGICQSGLFRSPGVAESFRGAAGIPPVELLVLGSMWGGKGGSRLPSNGLRGGGGVEVVGGRSLPGEKVRTNDESSEVTPVVVCEVCPLGGLWGGRLRGGDFTRDRSGLEPGGEGTIKEKRKKKTRLFPNLGFAFFLKKKKIPFWI